MKGRKMFFGSMVTAVVVVGFGTPSASQGETLRYLLC